MNLAEIKRLFNNQTDQITQRYIRVINQYMVDNYKNILKNGKMELSESLITSASWFTPSYKDDIIQQIKKYYIKDWDIEIIKHKRNPQGLVMLFTLKNYSTPESTDIIKKTEEKTERCEILDL